MPTNNMSRSYMEVSQTDSTLAAGTARSSFRLPLLLRLSLKFVPYQAPILVCSAVFHNFFVHELAAASTCLLLSL